MWYTEGQFRERRSLRFAIPEQLMLLAVAVINPEHADEARAYFTTLTLFIRHMYGLCGGNAGDIVGYSVRKYRGMRLEDPLRVMIDATVTSFTSHTVELDDTFHRACTR